jgi:hypothetical protein
MDDEEKEWHEPYKLTMLHQNFLVLFIWGNMIWPAE